MPFRTVDNSLRYRVTFQSRGSGPISGSLRLHWRGVSVGEWSQTVPVTLGATGGGWARSSVDIDPRELPGDPYVDALSVEILTPAWMKVDDFMLWEEKPGCPQGDVAAQATPLGASASGVGSLLTVSVSVSNAGCRDLRIASALSSPAAGLAPAAGQAFPFVVSAGETRTLTLHGIAPSLGPGAAISLTLQTNDADLPLLEVPLTLAAPPACGLLGAEALLALAIAPLLSALRGRRRRRGSAGRRDAAGCAG